MADHEATAFEAPAADAPPRRRRHQDDEDPERKRWVGAAIAVGVAVTSALIAILVLSGMQDKAI